MCVCGGGGYFDYLCLDLLLSIPGNSYGHVGKLPPFYGISTYTMLRGREGGPEFNSCKEHVFLFKLCFIISPEKVIFR